MNYSKWLLQVNEANEGFNNVKWGSSPRKWNVDQIDNETKKNNFKIYFFKNTFLFHISIKFFQNKKKLNSMGTSPMD